jgi:cytochrome c oxidase subunit 2
MTPRLRQGSPLPACALALALAGCGGNENTLAPHSHAESSITTIFWVVFGFSCFGFGVVCVLLFLGWWRRNTPSLPGGGGERAATAVVVGAGVALPIVLLVALFVYADLFASKATGAPSTTSTQMTIEVVGHQFWWEVRYPGTSVVTANEIHIPVHTRVKVLTSTADVIHSFWVPELNRKLDMIPGQTGAVLLDANKPGVYAGHCSEFCGLQHAHMVVLVYAQPRAQFQRWLARNAKPAAATSSAGSQAFMRDGCGDCHQVRGTSAHGRVGPDLTHFASRATIAAARVPNDPAHLREWLRNPQQLKPGSKMPDLALPDRDWRELQQYVESLR